MYECPNCGANLKFDIPSQMLGCEYCGTKMDPYAFQKEQDAEEGIGGDEYEVTVFTCPQCGGELISDDTTAATFCSFCGGATILDSRISREKQPGFIIPFQKTKDDCKKAYAKMLRRAIFAPKELKDAEQIEHFRSIYMPYWVYNFEKEDHLQFQGKTVRQRGNYEYTALYQLETDLCAEFKGLSFDASASFSDNLSSAIAPFDWKSAKRFTPSFLSGFYADTNDVGYDAYEDRARKVVVEEIQDRVTKNAECRKYQLSGLKDKLDPNVTQRELAMFPVWFLSYRKKDRVCYAVVNGQTGKVAADVPIDWTKYLIGSVLLALPIFILLNLLISMRATTMLVWSGILAALCCVISVRQKKDLQLWESNADDTGLAYYRENLQEEQFRLTDRQPEKQEEPKKKKKEDYGSFVRCLLMMGGYTIGFPFLLALCAAFHSTGSILFLAVAFSAWPVLVMNVGKKKKSSADGKPKLKATEWLAAVLKPGIGVVLAIIVLIVNPVSDLYYYGVAAGVMGLIGWNMVDIIARYNLLATRKFPQFNRRGGEEHV